MRTLVSVLALALVALPAAAEAPVTIPLRHISSADVERILFEGPQPLQGRGVIIPSGILALSCDGPSALQVSGSEQAVEQLRAIIRLVDVPARRVRLMVTRFVGAIEELPQRVKGEGYDVFVLTQEERQRIQEIAKNSPEHTLVGSNNRMARLFGTADREAETLVPRVNGDGSITLVMGAGGKTRSIQRIYRNETLLWWSSAADPILIQASLVPDGE